MIKPIFIFCFDSNESFFFNLFKWTTYKFFNNKQVQVWHVYQRDC